MQPIINAQGQVRGYLNKIANGDKQLLSKTGQLLGWYSHSSDQTFESPGARMIGFGDQLMTLLR